jgi:hypothetical protein
MFRRTDDLSGLWNYLPNVLGVNHIQIMKCRDRKLISSHPIFSLHLRVLWHWSDGLFLYQSSRGASSCRIRKHLERKYSLRFEGTLEDVCSLCVAETDRIMLWVWHRIWIDHSGSYVRLAVITKAFSRGIDMILSLDCKLKLGGHLSPSYTLAFMLFKGFPIRYAIYCFT